MAAPTPGRRHEGLGAGAGEPADGGGLSAWNDQGIDQFEVGRCAHLPDILTNALEDGGVLAHIPLQRQNAESRRPGTHQPRPA